MCWREAEVHNLSYAEWKIFKKDTDYQEHSKHCTLHLEGAENRGSFSGAAQPDDNMKLLMVNFAGATYFTVNLNLE